MGKSINMWIVLDRKKSHIFGHIWKYFDIIIGTIQYSKRRWNRRKFCQFIIRTIERIELRR
jgi:hypothetical protein